MNTITKYAYLDHNVLNDMHDGQEQRIFDFLDKNQLRVVYSDQNIDEIVASVKRKDNFVGVLSSLNALHINSPLDGNWKPTNELNIRAIHPDMRIQELEEARSSTTDISDGNELLAAIFGGVGELSIVDSVNNQLDEAQRMVDEVLAESPEYSSLVDLKGFEAKMKEARNGVTNQIAQMEKELLENGSPFSSDNIVQHLGYSISEISSVESPEAIIKLWKMVGPKLGGYETIEEYQAATIQASGAKFGLHGTEEQTVIQRANDLYLWLNIIGFHRDEKMGKPRRMKASMADMNHASYAFTCCSHFICRDKRLRYKAEAIYEHLNVATNIIDPEQFY